MQVHEFITNLSRLYKPSLGDNQIPFYNEFLEAQSEEFLENLWMIVIRTHLRTSPPTIGELNKYAATIHNARSPEEFKAVHKPSDEELLDSYLGRWALKQGWAHSYLIHCHHEGVPEQNDDMILFFQQGQHNAKMAYESLSENEGGIFDKALMNFYQSMREKNAMLKEKFAYLINPNAIAVR